VRQLAGGGDDGDVGVTPAAQLHEALEDAAPHLLVLGPADRDDPATFFALGDPAWTHCGADSSCRSPRPAAHGTGTPRAPRRRARTAVAAAKIASFAALAAAGVPTVGAFDLRHPDLEMVVPARAALLARGGVLGVPAPGVDRRFALPVRHGDAEPVGAARGLHAEESWLFAGEFHHAVCRGGIAVVVVVAPQGAERSEEHTSELQSRENLVCRLLLEKKK